LRQKKANLKRGLEGKTTVNKLRGVNQYLPNSTSNDIIHDVLAGRWFHLIMQITYL